MRDRFDVKTVPPDSIVGTSHWHKIGIDNCISNNTALYRDLLLRHQATHEKNAAHGQVGPDRTAERAVKACDACVVSKVKCDNTRPCQVCVDSIFYFASRITEAE